MISRGEGFELAYHDSGNTIHFPFFTMQIFPPSQKNHDTKVCYSFLFLNRETKLLFCCC